ncbi:galactofuranosyltransferase [Streptococcus orisratti]
MKFYVKEAQIVENVQKTAGIKARDDVEEVLSRNGFSEILSVTESQSRKNMGIFRTIKYHKDLEKIWKNSLKNLKKGDELVIQFPIVNHTIFFNRVIKNLQNRGVKIYLLIHDLETMRWLKISDIPVKSKIRLNIEESSVLKSVDGIISHNPSMTERLVQLGFNKNKIVNLEIFDYLIPNYDIKHSELQFKHSSPIVIAGNLKKYKAGYIYTLPDKPTFNLYGIGYEANETDNISYLGSFFPDELPFVLKGSFGLVWDGPSPQTCEGVHGDYLRINNPHKTSLYLAAGIPVIIWSGAALSSFILENKCGIVVDSLYQLQKILSEVEEDFYQELKNNAELIGERLRNGYYTLNAIQNIETMRGEK